MSGFPLDPKKTVSGIIVDPQTLERVVPNTKRKDGTVRKELKIRPGYTPTEDVARYKSTGQRDAARLKGFVPGASSATSSTYLPPSMSSESDYPSLSKAARKNLTRRMNKKSKEDLEREEDEAEDWDAEDGETDEAAKAFEAMTLAEKAKKEKEEEEAKGKASLRRAPRPGGGLFRELGIKTKDKPSDEPVSTAPSAGSVVEQEHEKNLIELSPPDAPAASTSRTQDDVPSPPTLAPPISTSASPSSSASPLTPSTKPKSKPPKSLLPSSLLASTSNPSSSPVPSPTPTNKPATKPSSVPGSSSSSNKASSKPGAGAGSARTRPEPKTRPGFSPMGQINGLLGGGPAPRTKRE